jgi:hypothetical protein
VEIFPYRWRCKERGAQQGRVVTYSTKVSTTVTTQSRCTEIFPLDYTVKPCRAFRALHPQPREWWRSLGTHQPAQARRWTLERLFRSRNRLLRLCSNNPTLGDGNSHFGFAKTSLEACLLGRVDNQGSKETFLRRNTRSKGA